MDQFSPSEAALEGFRVARRHPAALAAWCGVYFVGIAAIALVMAVVLGPSFIRFMSNSDIHPGAYDAYAEELIKYWPSIIAVVVLALFAIAVITNAMFRVMSSEQIQRRAGIRVGVDEVRVAVVHFVLSGLFLSCAAAFGYAMTAAVQMQPFVMLAGLALSVLIIWLLVRLGLALPATLLENRIAFDRAWRLSRGHFWPLLGMWVLSLVFYLMAWLLITALTGAFLALAAMVQASSSGVVLAVVVIVVGLLSTFVQMVSSVLQIVLPLAPTL
ncbi:MAG: hypothetical protein ABW042_01355, partial [Phenylobacterium sp.]